MYRVHYKGKLYHAEGSCAETAVMSLAPLYPELGNRSNFYVYVKGNEVRIQHSWTYIMSGRGEEREESVQDVEPIVYAAAPVKVDKPVTDYPADVEDDLALNVSILLDSMAYEFNRDLIKQQIDVALAAGDFDKCRELHAKLVKYES